MSAIDERRAAYRNQPSLDEVEVSIAWSGREYAPGQLVDLSARGAAVSLSLPASGVPSITEGTAVYLRFESPGIEPVSDIVAFVRNTRDASGERVFGLEIANWRGLHARLPPKLFSLFNRRQHYRVDVPQAPPVLVEVADHRTHEKYSARMCDISVGGCLLQFEGGDVIRAGDTVSLEFSLPASEYRFNLVGICRSNFQSGEFLQCGFAFETGGPEFNTQQQHISQYVMHRQRELLARGQG